MTGPVRRDYLKWAAASCALIATATAEYEIARACGISQWVAWTVPGALDAYALRAIAAHREVLTAVFAMVAVNAASHLVTAGILDVSWILVSAVSAIPPLVLWRVHALWTPSEHRKRVLWNVPDSVPQSVLNGHGTGHADTDTHAAVPTVPEHAPGTVDEHADTAIAVTAPDYVPEEWASTPDTGTDTSTGTSTGHTPADLRDTCEHGHPSAHRSPCPSCIERDREHGHTGRTRVLVSVPDLPSGYQARDDVTDTVHAADMEALGTLLAHIGEHTVPADTVGVRDVKSICGVGTPRARRVLGLLRETDT